MRELKTNVKAIIGIFSETYIIPDYQRPYTWDTESCQQLWDDIENFYEEKKKDEEKKKGDKYFLGCINVFKKGDNWIVIDGQQRLISLSLLIKAFYEKNVTYKGLSRCLFKLDKVTDEIDEKSPRIESKVLEGNNKEFKEIIVDSNCNRSTKLGKNYTLFVELAKKWCDKKNGEEIKKYIDTLLDDVEILCIESNHEDDALQTFETINDRGQHLNATDILKVKLYNQANNDYSEKKFINDWNELNNPLLLFTIYMCFLRAKDKIIDIAPKLKDYFTKTKKELLKDPQKVMSQLAKIQDISQENWNMSKKTMQWWKVIEVYPNEWWQYPSYVFLLTYMEKQSRNNYWDVKKIEKNFSTLIRETICYLTIKGINYRNLNRIKGTILKVCAAIAKKENYSKIYNDDLQKDDDKEKFKEEFKKHNDFGKYSKILVYLNSCLHEIEIDKDASKFYDNIGSSEKVEVEHILPKKWQDYNGWDQNKHAEALNKLGNLMLLPKKVNIKASNEFFKKKKQEYKKSKFSEAHELSESTHNNWGPKELQDRDEQIKKRIFKFLEID